MTKEEEAIRDAAYWGTGFTRVTAIDGNIMVARIDPREVYMTDARKAAIEAMARAASDAQLGVGVWKSFSESLRNDWLKSAEAHYTTLLEHLAATGWQLVPVAATAEMYIGGAVAWSDAERSAETYVDCADACYTAMLASAPKFGCPDGEG